MLPTTTQVADQIHETLKRAWETKAFGSLVVSETELREISGRRVQREVFVDAVVKTLLSMVSGFTIVRMSMGGINIKATPGEEQRFIMSYSEAKLLPRRVSDLRH